MGYEIDFLAVGENSQSGDAIAFRFGNLEGTRNEQTVVIIDGGFSESGEKLKELINTHYSGTNKVDLVISSHPDSDHSSGLKYILENMEVSELWMHQPWNHTEDMANLFHDGRITDNSLSDRIKNSLETAYSLEQIAKDKNITIKEPFTGLTDKSGNVRVLGPTKDYYENLLLDFRSTPESKASKEINILEKALILAKKIFENWFEETLTDDGETSAENNSSTIILFSINNNHTLFTADAGIPALEKAAEELETLGVSYSDITRIQVPHHGSKRNVGQTILNRIIGPILSENEEIKTAIVLSAKEGEPKHPSKIVLNAFKRRGVKVFRPINGSHCASENAPKRDGYSPATPLPFYYEVEED